ncbi:MAG: Crp/Fnr family transcriptional regulator [bacterium]
MTAGAGGDAGRCEEALCRQCLGRHPAVGDLLSEDDKAFIHRYRKRLRFAPGERICAHRKLPPFVIGNLTAGVIKLTFPTVPGRVGALLFPGDFLGPFSDSASVHYSASALSDCELCCFEGAGLHRVFARYPTLQQNFLRHFAESLERAREDAAKLRRPQAAARVAALLRLFAERADDEREHGEREVELPLTRAETALLLGLTTETVSRCLSRMRRDGIIRPHSRHHMTIKSPPRLKALAEN